MIIETCFRYEQIRPLRGTFKLDRYNMTCGIFHIYLSSTNNYITQFDVLQSNSKVNGWKIQKKDKLLAITFSGTTGTIAAGMRLYMNTLQGTLYLNHFM